MALSSRNIVLGLIGGAVVAGLAYVSFRPEPVPVDLHTLSRGDFAITVDVDGVSRVADVFEISAPISGVAHRSPVEVGDPVIGGETVVARVEPASPALLDWRTRLQAEADVHEAEASLEVARSEMTQTTEDQVYEQSQYDRVEHLVERGVASIARLEEAHQRLAVANAALEAAGARIAQARGRLERAEATLVEATTPIERDACCVPIHSPADGVVLDVDVISARPVTMGARLLTVGDPAKLELVADLLSADAVRLPDGARAFVERWGGPALEARLRHVEPAGRMKVSALGIEEQRVDAIFDLVANNGPPQALGHEFAVFLRIVEYEEADALLVPLSATFRVADGWAVFRADGGRVERVPVQLGRRNARFAVVEEGLAEGDRVVEHPREDLTDGALIVERDTF